MNKPKPVKTYNLKLYTEEQRELFEKFQNAVVYSEETVVNAILDSCAIYINEAVPKGITLMSELELIRTAKEMGLTAGRSSIKKYRNMGVLEDDKGKWWKKNEDGYIVYISDPVLDFLKERNKDPFSKLIQD